MLRNRGIRVSSGRHYSEAEDAIIRQAVRENRTTESFLFLLPGRTAGSVDARISSLGLPSRKPVGRRQHRNIYLDKRLDDALQSLAQAQQRAWQEIVTEAIEEKLRRA